MTLDAGPALDARVAREVMGWKENHDFAFIASDPKCGLWSYHHRDSWSPSTNIAHAWEVYMEMYNKPSANRWVLVERLMGMPSATFCWNDNRPDAVAQAETMPLAICLAALAAIQGQP